MAITERRPTLTDCGCEVTVYADGSGIELHYCPMHQAAEEMLRALREVQPYILAADKAEYARSCVRSAIANTGG